MNETEAKVLSTITKEEKKADNDNWLLKISSEHRLRSENLAYDIDVWYPILKNFTFPSIFLPFRRREAIAIIHYYQTRYIHNTSLSECILTNYDIQILVELENVIAHILSTNDSNYNFTNGSFMRLCGRSPKDSEPLNRSFIRKKYNLELQKLVGDNGKEVDANTKLIAIAHTQWLKINTAEEAMSQLLTSERVFTDLHDWIRYGEPEQIVFREFCDELSLDFEFRAYIHENRMTAISQYDHYGIYPYLQPMKQHLQELIVGKWKEVHPYILQDSYCIDFGFIQSSDSMIVIEISPFRRCTGPACFNWDIDKDLLFGGKNEIEFRLNTKSHPHLSDLIEANWELKWWQPTDPPPYWYWYGRVNDSQWKDWQEFANWTNIQHKEISNSLSLDPWKYCWIFTAVFTVLAVIIGLVWHYSSMEYGLIFGSISLCFIAGLWIFLWKTHMKHAQVIENVPLLNSEINALPKNDGKKSNAIFNPYNSYSKKRLQSKYDSNMVDEEFKENTEELEVDELYDIQVSGAELKELNSRTIEFDSSLGHCAPIFQISPTLNNTRHILFVYGTLKSGFHWSHKFFSRGGQMMCNNANTVDKYPLVMGDCNVPYVLNWPGTDEYKNSNENGIEVDLDGAIGHQIRGEIWSVDYETLIGLDEYEGISKGHYTRKSIQVHDNNKNEILSADIYMKAVFDHQLLESKEMMNEYEFGYHKKYYSPIKHIQVKQLAYLGENFDLT